MDSKFFRRMHNITNFSKVLMKLMLRGTPIFYAAFQAGSGLSVATQNGKGL